MDSQIRNRFKIFCQTYVVGDSPSDDENLYQMFKYAYLIGRKDCLDEIKNDNPPDNIGSIN